MTHRVSTVASTLCLLGAGFALGSMPVEQHWSTGLVGGMIVVLAALNLWKTAVAADRWEGE